MCRELLTAIWNGKRNLSENTAFLSSCPCGFQNRHIACVMWNWARLMSCHAKGLCGLGGRGIRPHDKQNHQEGVNVTSLSQWDLWWSESNDNFDILRKSARPSSISADDRATSQSRYCKQQAQLACSVPCVSLGTYPFGAKDPTHPVCTAANNIWYMGKKWTYSWSSFDHCW